MLMTPDGISPAAAEAAARAAAEAAAKAAAEAAAKAAAEAAAKAAAEAAAKAATEAAAKAAPKDNLSTTNSSSGALNTAANANYGAMPFASEPAPPAPTGDQSVALVQPTSAEQGGGTKSINSDGTGVADKASTKSEEGSVEDQAVNEKLTNVDDRAMMRNPDAVIAKAKQQVDAQAAQQAQAARAALPADQQKQFDQVVAAAQKSGVPSAAYDTQQLLSTGKFQQNPDLLSQLSRVASSPVIPSVTAAGPNMQNRLLGEVVRQVAEPATIGQDKRYNTCAEAAIERQMAASKPAEYAKFIADTIAPNPIAAHLGGIRVSIDTLQLASSAGEDSNRSVASALFQQGVHATFCRRQAESPLTPDEFNSLHQAAFPNQGNLATFNSRASQAVAMQALEAGSTAVIQGHDGGGLHAVNVTSVDEGKVTFIDPNGVVATVSAAAFQEHLHGAFVHSDAGVTDEKLNQGIGDGYSMNTTATATHVWYRRRTN